MKFLLLCRNQNYSVRIQVQGIIGSQVLREVIVLVLLTLCVTLAMADEKNPGLEAQGILSGIARISVPPEPGRTGFSFQPVANVKIYLSDDPQILAGGPEPGVVAVSQADGKFTFWDPSIGGGNREVTATWTPPGGIPLTQHVKVIEVVVRQTGANSVPDGETLRRSKNSGWVTLLFNPPAPVPAATP